MSPPRLVLCLVCVVMLGVPGVHAAPGRRATPEQQQAHRHYRAGVALFEQRRLEPALVELERAYDLGQQPIVLYYLAACHRKLERYAEALGFYERFLTEGKGRVRRRQLAAAKHELAAMLARIARVTVVVGPVEGAALTLDDLPLGTLPLPMPLYLSPGKHQLTVTASGYRDAERTLRLARGAHTMLEVTLEPLPPPPPPPPPERIDVAARPIATAPGARRFRLGASFGTNLGSVRDTGAPSLGLGVALGPRLQVGIDVVLVAYAVMPSVQVHVAQLRGEALSVHAIGALPIVFPGDEMGGGTFLAAAAGVGVRYRPTATTAVRLESLVSFAGAAHGTTFPAFLGGELWF